MDMKQYNIERTLVMRLHPVAAKHNDFSNLHTKSCKIHNIPLIHKDIYMRTQVITSFVNYINHLSLIIIL